MKKIILAGGCFWGVQAYYDKVEGVKSTETGYIDGDFPNPTYEQVCNGSNHAEAVRIEFDESKVSLKRILEHYFQIIDPTTLNRQGNDLGKQYRTAIFYFNDNDKLEILNFIDKIKPNYNKPIRTEVKEANEFYPAEDYHQKYLKKNPCGYCHIDLSLVDELDKEFFE
ncbi:MAG: peptide-methionine (S)-S-oxide reductase MsrA [Candidatus Izemoplasmatales bacterium]|jgi:methionine-S-sulfoxide reductase|nr:peptide-methionine (S)-S-oxide reductase MsrA [Candidatus Izemoplasmatales bacterium]